MLEHLHIRNLALVVDLEIDFASGFTVITGETGAGKSLILGALNLLLGGRADKGMIRRGASQCEVTAILCLDGEHASLRAEVNALLQQAGVPISDEAEPLLLRRVITPGGSRAYLNSVAVTAAVLRELGELLVDIHGPHDHQSLLQPRCQLDLLDAYAGSGDEVAACQKLYAKLLACRQQVEALRSEHMSLGELELMQHQLREITAVPDLAVGLDQELSERHAVVSNARRLIEVANACQQALGADDGGMADALRRQFRALQEIAQLDSGNGSSFVNRLEEIMTLLQDLAADLGDYAENCDLDQQELFDLESQLDQVQKLKRRFGPTVADVLATAERCRSRLASWENREKRMHELQADVTAAEQQLLAQCQILAQKRRPAAAELGAAISSKLQRLGFAQGHFEVVLAADAPTAHGADRVEFVFAPNPGEALLPLRQIASSGEIARVMLAVKTVLTTADRVPVLVFDEVDANIGGRVAVMVAEELVAIGSRHQVLCISHLPQIAAAAPHHFRVSKCVTDDGRTITTMIRLLPEQRQQELMRMLGAQEDGDSVAKEHAKALLQRHQHLNADACAS